MFSSKYLGSFMKKSLFNRFSANEFMGLALIVSLIFSWMFIGFLKKRKLSQAPSPLFSILWGLVLFTSLSLALLKVIDSYTERATVVVSKVDLKSGPGE